MSTHGSRAAAALRPLLFAAVGAAVAVAVWASGALAGVDRVAGDVLLRLTHRHVGAGPVAAIAIDDRAVDAVGPLPWSRDRLAELVLAAREAGAAAVVVDLLLTDAGAPNADHGLEAALGSGPSILAAALAPDGGWILPEPRFGGADRAAHVHVEVAADGVARVIVATKQAAGLSLPAMSLAAARLLRPEMAIMPGALLRPDFRPAPSRIPTVSAADLWAEPEAAAELAGKLVFVGVTATGAGDRLVVPTEPGPAPSPGVLVHASAASSLLRGGLVRPVTPWWVALGALLAALATQVARDRAGSLRPHHLVAVLAAVATAAVIALQADHLLLAVTPLALAPVAAVVAREAVESRTAQHASGRLLAALLRHHGAVEPAAVPVTAAGRLAALQELQTAVLREDRARRALLDGMGDGVVMWDGAGRVVIANPAAGRLWQGEPTVAELERSRADAAAGRDGVVQRPGREISVSVVDLDDGGLAILRDVTAERELERRRRDMQRLVSHELKTPLASIAGLGETIERYELDRDEQRRAASLIRTESSRLGSMVATFLDLERLGSGSWEPPEHPTDLAELVEQRLGILDESARTREQRIERRLEHGSLVRAQPTLLERVVDNLVGNALKYSPDGATVTVEVVRRDTEAVLTVADHGSGIPEEAIPHLFERFYRVPGTRGSGSGLGLAVAHEVVTWHGGCITVDSTIGRGTTFSVRLPGEG